MNILKSIIARVLILTYFLLLVSVSINAQNSRLLDLTFDPNIEVGKGLFTLAVQDDNKIIVAGKFSQVSDEFHVMRLHKDGKIDSSFLAGRLDRGYISSIVIQPDQKVIICGDFDSYNGVACNRILRLNPEGSIDSSFIYTIGADKSINVLVLQQDGKILIGGDFSSYDGIERIFIARLNNNGTLDTLFHPGKGPSNKFSPSIHSMVEQPDGKIIVAGDFREFNGIISHNIVRLNADGSVDFSFNSGDGANSVVCALAVKPDGRILIAGYFSKFNGKSRNRIALLTKDGKLDTSFNPGKGVEDNVIWAIAFHPSGNILVGGDFNSYNRIMSNNLVIIKPNGRIDKNIKLNSGANKYINTIVIQKDGKALIGGWFTFFEGVRRNHIARINLE